MYKLYNSKVKEKQQNYEIQQNMHGYIFFYEAQIKSYYHWLLIATYLISPLICTVTRNGEKFASTPGFLVPETYFF